MIRCGSSIQRSVLTAVRIRLWARILLFPVLLFVDEGFQPNLSLCRGFCWGCEGSEDPGTPSDGAGLGRGAECGYLRRCLRTGHA
ncbi:hypothetical protein BDP55DRAFT_681208, partial [Colletotrichum godetiae]